MTDLQICTCRTGCRYHSSLPVRRGWLGSERADAACLFLLLAGLTDILFFFLIHITPLHYYCCRCWCWCCCYYYSLLRLDAYAHTHIRTYVHTYIHTYIQTYLHTTHEPQYCMCSSADLARFSFPAISRLPATFWCLWLDFTPRTDGSRL